MAYTTIESVASFSVVLGEAFAAVALSTLVPATFVAVTKGAKTAIAAAAGNAAAVTAAETSASTSLASVVSKGPVKEVLDVIVKTASASTGIDLLIPKTANIHAEFEFQGSESYSAEASLGAMVEVVTVKVGFSALYATTSKNKITLDVDFALVHYDL